MWMAGCWLLRLPHCRDDMQKVFPPPISIPFGANSFGFGHNIRPWLSGQLGEKRSGRVMTPRGERQCYGEAKGKKENAVEKGRICGWAKVK
jgi:hypothetical protein